MAEPDREPPRYRPAVGIMLQNRQREVLVGRRLDMPMSPAWQMPHGGVSHGENPLLAARAVRLAVAVPSLPRSPTHPASRFEHRGRDTRDRRLRWRAGERI